MALQESSSAKTTADSNKPADGVIYSSSIITHLDSKITTESNAGNYLYCETFRGRVSGDEKQIEQPDRSYESLNDVVQAIADKGYTCTYNDHTLKDGSLKIKLQIYWG